MPNPLDWIPTSGKFQDAESDEVLWDELENTAYARIVTSNHDFVKFLQDVHVPDERVHYPPEGGWPKITAESFTAMKKSDRVIEVLRNMAYIDGSRDNSPCEILLETALIDYTEPSLISDIKAGEVEDILFATEPFDEPVPKDVVALTVGGREFRMILLDCRYGIARWMSCGEGRTKFGLNTKGDPANDTVDTTWGGDTAWPVEEFFEYIKKKFVSMEQLSYNQSRLVKENYDVCGIFEVIKEIYCRHGWPGENYQKKDCMNEVVAYCTEHEIN